MTSYKTLLERVNLEYYVDEYGSIVKYKPYFAPLDITLSNGCPITEFDNNNDPFAITSLHSAILKQVVGFDDYYMNPKCSTDILEIDRGWIAIGKAGYGKPICHRKPTQSQIDRMFDLGYTNVKEKMFYGTTKPYWEFSKN